MRVVRARGGESERGATAVLVAILLVVLLGMLSVSVDGGFLFLKFRGLRNANDAAALAAALSCATKEGELVATAQADTLAKANVGDAVAAEPPVYNPSCDSPYGTVTVHYKGEQTLFFSRVVGVSSPKTVSATATATWGLAGGASNIAPIMLSMSRLSDCNIPYGPPAPVKGDKCAFYWNNDPVFLGNAGWALMNLDQWDVLPTDQCSNAGFDSYRDWILYGYPGFLDLNNPPPTYVCRDSGSFGGALNDAIEAAILAGGMYAFPVNDPSEQIDRYGNLCPPPDCTPDKYYIVGFAWLKLIDICKGTGGGTWSCKISNDNASYCTGFLVDSNARCLISQWEGFTTSGLAPSDSSTFGNMIAVTLSG